MLRSATRGVVDRFSVSVVMASQHAKLFLSLLSTVAIAISKGISVLGGPLSQQTAYVSVISISRSITSPMIGQSLAGWL